MTYDSDYEVRLATLQAMGGDVTKHFDSVYEIDLEILDIVQHGGGGGGGAVIDDDHVSTATTWSSSKIVSELADAGFDVEIVTELPTTGDAHTIYFIASSSSQTGNVYDEYMYINSNWEQVGSTAVDLSNYYTKSEVDTALSAKADEADLADYATWNVVNTSLGLKQDTLTAGTNITIDNNVISAASTDLSNYYNKTEVDTALAGKADDSDLADYATWNVVNTSLGLKQDTLTAGTNITIANNVISAASTDLSNYYNKTEVDTALAGKVDDSDLNSYYNKTEVDTALAGKQDTLTAGTNITILNNVISATGGGSGVDVIELTQAEYDALPTSSKNSGDIYSITDATIITPMTKAQADTYYNPINTVTANSGNYKFPNWNANGQITGQAAQAYQISANVNGTSKTLYATGSGNLPTVYGPTSAGTAGYYLVSSGSGAPVWQELEVASDFVIADADAIAGTYSTDIAAFYTKTIEENIMQGVQIKIVDSHNVPTYAVDDTNPIGILSDGDLFVVADGETATIVVNDGSDHTISIAADGTITDADSTGAVASSNVVRVDGGYLFEFDGNSTYTWVSITSDGAFAVITGTDTVTSDSYYLPSSSRIFGNNIELWLMYTEDGATWQNIHYLIDGSSISRTVTNGQFGPVNA